MYWTKQGMIWSLTTTGSWWLALWLVAILSVYAEDVRHERIVDLLDSEQQLLDECLRLQHVPGTTEGRDGLRQLYPYLLGLRNALKIASFCEKIFLSMTDKDDMAYAALGTQMAMREIKNQIANGYRFVVEDAKSKMSTPAAAQICEDQLTLFTRIENYDTALFDRKSGRR